MFGLSNQAEVPAGTRRFRGRPGYARVARISLGLILLITAAYAPLQSASAAPSGSSSCDGRSTMDGPVVLQSWIGYPGDEECFEVWLETGYTYTFKVDPSTHPIDPEFNSWSAPLTDSILTVYRDPVPAGYRGIFPPLEFIGYNDDISSYDRSSRVVFEATTPVEYGGPVWFRYPVIVGGYGQHTGAFKLTISRSVTASPEWCPIYYGC